MIDLIITFILLFGTCCVYWQLNSNLYSKLASTHKWSLAPLLGPGVVIHELSHLIMALVTFRRVTSFSLYSFGHTNGELGYVNFSHRSGAYTNYVINGLIGLAPIAGGIGALYLVSIYLLDISAIYIITSGLSTLSIYQPIDLAYWYEVKDILVSLVMNINVNLNSLLWLYAVITICHGTIPSTVDMRLALPIIGITLGVCLIFISLEIAALTDIASTIDTHLNTIINIVTFMAVPLIILNILGQAFHWISKIVSR